MLTLCKVIVNKSLTNKYNAMKIKILKFALSVILFAGFATMGIAQQKDCSSVEPSEQKSCFDQLVAFNLSELIEYPQDAQFEETEGKVYVRFTTNENNEIGNIRILGKSNEALNEAVIKAVKKLAAQNQDGMIMASSVYRIPVDFTLRD